jgi:hypothetical protein
MTTRNGKTNDAPDGRFWPNPGRFAWVHLLRTTSRIIAL